MRILNRLLWNGCWQGEMRRASLRQVVKKGNGRVGCTMQIFLREFLYELGIAAPGVLANDFIQRLARLDCMGDILAGAGCCGDRLHSALLGGAAVRTAGRAEGTRHGWGA